MTLLSSTSACAAVGPTVGEPWSSDSFSLSVYGRSPFGVRLGDRDLHAVLGVEAELRVVTRERALEADLEGLLRTADEPPFVVPVVFLLLPQAASVSEAVTTVAATTAVVRRICIEPSRGLFVPSLPGAPMRGRPARYDSPSISGVCRRACDGSVS